MLKFKTWFFFTVTLLLLNGHNLMAQCAMCKASVANNVSHGETSLGAGLNFGIMYLFVTPYLLIAVIGLLWYKNSKANARKFKTASHIKK